jgi:hypothetical protein
MCKDVIVDRNMHEKQILIYADEHGNEPFSIWIHNLKDISGRNRYKQKWHPESPVREWQSLF